MKKVTLGGLLIVILFFLSLYFLLTKPKLTKLEVSKTKTMIKIKSPAFAESEMIPTKYTCKGGDINPSLIIENVPFKAKSLVLIVDDPDAPMGTFTHWLVWNISPLTKEISENNVPVGAIEGRNDFGKISYGGPCPPFGTHRYYFKIYALDTTLSLSSGATRNELEKAMEGHILDRGELMGKFSK